MRELPLGSHLQGLLNEMACYTVQSGHFSPPELVLHHLGCFHLKKRRTINCKIFINLQRRSCRVQPPFCCLNGKLPEVVLSHFLSVTFQVMGHITVQEQHNP